MFLGLARPTFISNETSTPNKIEGDGGSFGLAVGGAVRRGLILYGEFTIAGPGKPTRAEGPLELRVKSANVVGVGLGAAYYLMPINVYFSASALASFLSVETEDGSSKQTSVGPGLSLMVGKEWWVARNWGLGIAAQYWVSTMGGGDLGGARWKSRTGTLAFTATYN